MKNSPKSTIPKLKDAVIRNFVYDNLTISSIMNSNSMDKIASNFVSKTLLTIVVDLYYKYFNKIIQVLFANTTTFQTML